MYIKECFYIDKESKNSLILKQIKILDAQYNAELFHDHVTRHKMKYHQQWHI